MGGAGKRTPLYSEHDALGGKLVDFHGWEMPLQYSAGILKEHETVRRSGGLFDVSHMGRLVVSGPGAVGFVDTLITNNLSAASEDQLLYTPVCNESGGILDDVTVYRLPDSVMIVANAGNRERIWSWLQEHAAAWSGESISLSDRSDELGQIAFQGPKSEAVFAPLVEGDLAGLAYYRHMKGRVAGIDGVLVSRNGYTGEDGFEIYVPAERTADLWRAILQAGSPEGVLPIGLGARDTLRMEMCYALYGNELTPEITPLEAGMRWTVKMKKGVEFIGKKALAARKDKGLDRVLAGFEVQGKRLPRHGEAVFQGAREVGFITSGGFCPSLKTGMAMGYVPPGLSETGTELEADVRGARVPIRVTERPFYKDGSHR